MKLIPISLAAVMLGATHSHAIGIVTLLDLGGGLQSLNQFDSSTPGASNLTPITGLGLGETLLGLDYRPLNGQLYGIGSGNNLYTVNTVTGAASLVGSGFSSATLTAGAYGFDFNPTIDRIRLVGTDDSNLVVNPITGEVQLVATSVFYTAGDLNEGQNPNLVHHAYTPSTFGALGNTTQLYGIDSALDVLVTQANNTGVLVTVGDLGFDIDEAGGFDIALDGTAYAALTVGGVAGLYTINLATGEASLAGALAGNVSGFAVVPEPTTALLGALGALALLRRRRGN